MNKIDIKSIFIGIICIAFFSGCATTKELLAPAFSSADAEELANYTDEGPNTIKGQVFLKTRGGEVRYGAGNVVKLLPITAYGKEIENLKQSQSYVKVIGIDPRYESAARETVTDGSANFEFQGLPDGEYLVSSKVTWEVPCVPINSYDLSCAMKGGTNKEGGVIEKTVTVSDGQERTIMLTR